jgi:peptide-methionine (R)-S-oxide reductase
MVTSKSSIVLIVFASLISCTFFNSNKSITMSDNSSNIDTITVIKSDSEWQAQLTPEQYRVTRLAGTEAPFTGKYWNTTDTGKYVCIGCGAPLFKSDDKFDSGCGWPSYSAADDSSQITEIKDLSHGMVRTEVRCAKCNAHLGHLFDDGPSPSGMRYCINSASINLIKKK